jgi:hypothetical protein
MRPHTQTSAMKLMTGFWLWLPIFTIALACSSCGKNDRDKSQDATTAADSAGSTEDTGESASNEETKFDSPADKQDSDEAQRFAEGPRNVPFGGSKQIEFSVPKLFDPLTHQNITYVGGEFRSRECLESVGIKPTFESISQGESTAQGSFSVSIDDLGSDGYEGFLKSLKGCKNDFLMVLVSDNEQSSQRGYTPMIVKLRYSRFGVTVEEPRPQR